MSARSILQELLHEYRSIPRPPDTIQTLTLSGRSINAALDFLDTYDAEGGQESESLGVVEIEIIAVNNTVELRFDGKRIGTVQSGILDGSRSDIEWR